MVKDEPAPFPKFLHLRAAFCIQDELIAKLTYNLTAKNRIHMGHLMELYLIWGKVRNDKVVSVSHENY